jgi:hypothetical protein
VTARIRIVLKLVALAALVMCLLLFSISEVDFVYTGF